MAFRVPARFREDDFCETGDSIADKSYVVVRAFSDGV